jgi:hypothetical protein
VSTDLQQAAVEFVAHGWRLVPLGADKRPLRAKWNERARVVDTVEAAASLTCAGVGLAHAYSRTACVDIDDPLAAIKWSNANGLSFMAMREAPGAVVIESPKAGRYKLLFRLPHGVAPLRTVVPVKGVELRCASANGKTVQDVLPPSAHPAGGSYRWAGAGLWQDLPVLPDDLLAVWQALGAGTTPDDAPELPADYPEPLGLSRVEALKVLAKIDPDVSYPEWIRVGQALQHEFPDGGLELWMSWSATGQKYPGPDLLREKWEGFGHAAHPVTMRSVIRDYASTADPDEFEVIPDARAEEIAGDLLRVQDILKLPLPTWIIRGVLPQAGLGVVYGAPGAGKSFVALDMAMAIARGRAWNERRTTPGRVLYVAAEGAGGMVARVKAYCKTHALDDVADFRMLRRSVNLTSDEWKPLAEQVAGIGGADVIVFDTLARCMAGADENNSEGMGRVINSCERLHAATGALILLVHHSGKDATRGARGWSGLKGAVDVEMMVDRLEGTDLRVLSLTKQKDGDDSGDFYFKLTPVDIGKNDQGDDVPAKVLEYVPPPAVDPRTETKAGATQSLVLQVLDQLTEFAEDGWTDFPAMVIECVRQMPHDPEGVDNRRRDVRSAVEKLRKKGIIEVDNNRVRRV